MAITLRLPVENLDNNVSFEEMDFSEDLDSTQMDQSVEDEELSQELSRNARTFYRFCSDETVAHRNICKVCFVRLPPKQLRRHTKIHEEESTIQCSSCCLIFGNGLLLSWHKKSHYNEIEPDKSEFNHEVLESAKPICAFCDISFDCETELSAHKYDVFCDYCKQKILCNSW